MRIMTVSALEAKHHAARSAAHSKGWREASVRTVWLTRVSRGRQIGSTSARVPVPSVGTLEIHRPVRFPGAATVGRERLLPLRMTTRIGAPGEVNPDGPAVERVVGVEETGDA